MRVYYLRKQDGEKVEFVDVSDVSIADGKICFYDNNLHAYRIYELSQFLQVVVKEN